MRFQAATIGNTARKVQWRPELAPDNENASRAASLKAIEVFGTVVLVGRDQEVYAEGDPADYCYKLVSGVVRTVKLMPDGRRQVAEFYLPKDLFGFDSTDPRDLAAEAVTDVTLIRYPRRQIEAQAQADAGFAQILRDMTFGSLRKAHKQMLLLARKSAQERIASFLLDLASRASTASGDAIELPMTRNDIADHLGLTLETVSRVLNRLHRDDVINLTSTHRVELTNRSGLTEICGEA